MSGDGNKKVWTTDTIAGAILGCVACIFVQAQLQTVAVRLNSPLLNSALPWWPAILVVAGVIVLLRKRSMVHGAKEVVVRPREVSDERRTRNIPA